MALVDKGHHDRGSRARAAASGPILLGAELARTKPARAVPISWAIYAVIAAVAAGMYIGRFRFLRFGGRTINPQRLSSFYVVSQ